VQLDRPLASRFASRHPSAMASPITINIPHQLGRAEARRRIESGFTNIIQQFPGGSGTSSHRWDGDRLSFSATALGQTVAGGITVSDAAVAIEIQLPSVLGLIAGRLKDRLQKAGHLLLTKK
jgi:Putative polyhydroxyalkanoic acid system protein (PHA_gran_rgn)